MADITIAPLVCRMCVLRLERNFTIPETYINWYKWKKNLLEHPAVMKTR